MWFSLAQQVAALEAENAALKAPVSDEEWMENERTAVNNRGIVDAMTQKQADALIAARARDSKSAPARADEASK